MYRFIYKYKDASRNDKKHYLPMYGNKYGGDYIQGHSCGILSGIYTDGNKISDDKSFSFNINLYIPEKNQELYTIHALLQNVYTSHYAAGYIVHGYILDLDDNINLDDEIDKDIDLYNIVHRFEEGNYFIGFKLGNIDTLEDIDDSENVAKQLLATYTTTDAKREFLRSNIMTEFLKKHNFTPTTSEPVIMFIPIMCFCCT